MCCLRSPHCVSIVRCIVMALCPHRRPMPHHDSRAIANWFIRRGQLDGGRAFTPMQLQKLVYIAHGWNLVANDGQELVSEPVEAWDYGPVYPVLYSHLANWGADQVRKPIKSYARDWVGREIDPDLDPDEAEVLEAVYEGYAKLNGLQLSNLTHQPGTPWSDTYEQGVRHKRIPNELIRRHFDELAQK